MYANDSAVIRQRFAAQWAGVSPTIAYTFGDVKFDPPAAAPWVRLTILPGEAVQVEMGMKRRVRRTGLVVVDIFVPAGSGDGLAKSLGDAVAGIFQLRTLSGVVFRATSMERVGPDGPWVQYSASTPYQADSLIDNPV
jgi:hypothetical protein